MPGLPNNTNTAAGANTGTHQTLFDFYRDVTAIGLTRDYQLRLKSLTFGDYFSDISWYATYAKDFYLPSIITDKVNLKTKGTTAVYGTNQLDYSDKDNYQITFRCDPHYVLYNRFTTLLTAKDPKESTKPITGTVQLESLSETGVPLGLWEFTNVALGGVSQIKFSKEGTGKVMDFTAVFRFSVPPTYNEAGYDKLPYPNSDFINSNPGSNGTAIQTFWKDTQPPATSLLTDIKNTLNDITGTATAVGKLGKAIRGR